MRNPNIDWIIEALRANGKTRSGLAAALDRSPSMITDLLTGKRKLLASEVPIIAEYLGVEPGSGVPAEIEIIGIAGAGPSGEIEFGSSDGNLGTASAPPGATHATRALEVRGISMRGFANEGWLVYYNDDDRRPIDDTMIAVPCVCWLADGRVLIKTPYRAAGGAFNLESFNPAFDTIRDIFVESAAPISAIVPRPAVRGTDPLGEVAA